MNSSSLNPLYELNGMFNSSAPYTRWWWFADGVELAVVEKQLRWVKDNGFGGVEIAWLYPYTKDYDKDSVVRLFSEEWVSLVRETLELCRKLGLGCDVTYATAWPFCGSFIPLKYSSKRIEGYSSQVVEKSWESAYLDHPVPVLDHLDSSAVVFYMDYLKEHGFALFAEENPGISFFCDSLEVEMDCIGYEGIREDFQNVYGLDLDSYCDRFDEFPDIRYCYRKLIASKYLEVFFNTYMEKCHEVGALGRVQCHGAMVDLLEAYSKVDIPESESILFYPDFSLIPASAATICGKRLVASETFTCLYGWVPAPLPAPRLKDEELYDLQCLADSQFAFGVNQVVYHGMPYWGKEFYAGIHVGPEGSLSPCFKSLNRYLTTICGYMRKGRVFSHLAVYLPFEDQLMKDEVPECNRTISNRYYWEMQEVKMPHELNPYRPIYCSLPQLRTARVAGDGSILFFGQGGGEPTFVADALYCYSEYLDLETIEALAEIKELGGRVIFKEEPVLAGLASDPVRSGKFKTFWAATTSDDSLTKVRRILESTVPLDYWSRWDAEKNIYYLFVAHPDNRNLSYPMEKGFHGDIRRKSVSATFWSEQGISYPSELVFSDHSSVLVIIDENDGTVSCLDTNELW